MRHSHDVSPTFDESPSLELEGGNPLILIRVAQAGAIRGKKKEKKEKNVHFDNEAIKTAIFQETSEFRED